MTSPNAEAARQVRPSPDEEALELLLRLADGVEVARSFARICAGLVQERAVRASATLVPSLRYARAAADAAKTVAAAEMRRVFSSAMPDPRERAPGTGDEDEPGDDEDDEDDEDVPSSLDHEALHDDAC
jgi:hypothetical protein